MKKIDEIIQICVSVFEGNQSLDLSVVNDIHTIALAIKMDGDEE